MTQIIEQRGDYPTLADIIPTPIVDKRLWRSYWTTPEALASHVEAMGDGTNNWQRSAWKSGSDFTGTKNMKEAIKLCRDGWPEGAARAASLRDRITAQNPMGPRIVRWDVAGALPSIPRALSGNPMCMKRIDSARLRRKPILTLLSDMSCNGGVPADALTNRAAVVAAIIDAVESAGYACEVITFEYSRTSEVGQIVATTVKESHVAADIGRLAYSLGHASFFRRLTWAAFTCDRFTSDLGSGLGSRTQINETRANESGAYVMPSAEANISAFNTEDSAATAGLNFILESLTKQGCPAFTGNA